MCSDLTIIFVPRGCIVAMVLVLLCEKPAAFVEPTAETAVNKVSDLSETVTWTQCGIYEIYKPS